MSVHGLVDHTKIISLDNVIWLETHFDHIVEGLASKVICFKWNLKGNTL
jgi:hypothetical protein